MKLTKYGHACFMLEEQGQRLIVDPGIFTELPDDLTNIAVVIITHEHPDHFDQDKLQQILAGSPDAQIFAAKEVAAQLPGSTEPARAHQYQAGPFSLEFYGDMHASVRPGMSQITNLGVCINDVVAFPGDSYDQLAKRVKVIMAPVNAPWTDVAKTHSYVFNAQADIIIPTHDALLSNAGHAVYDAHLRDAAEQSGSVYRPLAVGESIEIA